MKLIVQPDAGIAPVVSAIKQARKSINILIFRLDRAEIAHALEAAVARGVRVRALTAHANRGGTKSLRKLEMELLAAGVTVSRTADDLVRYHGKMMIVDNKVLHVYGFNFTGLDMLKSRSFGIITKNDRLVNESTKLFMADFDRLPYTPGYERFVVSPENARDRLSRFISGARRQLLIYDPQVSDDAMLRLITERIKAGVDVRVIGKVSKKGESLNAEKMPGMRLHLRAILRDGQEMFVGSMSLRGLELDRRREVGIILKDRTAARQFKELFEEDWAKTESAKKAQEEKEKEKALDEKKEEKAAAAAAS